MSTIRFHLPRHRRRRHAALLASRGIQVDLGQMNVFLQEAVASLVQTLYRSDPAADLTKAEIDALERGGFAPAAELTAAEDPLARTAAEYAALLETSLTTAEASVRLGVDPSRIRQRLTSTPPSLLGIRLKEGWRLPLFQFHAKGLLPGLEEVAAQLDPEIHPVAVYRWFTHANPDLEGPDGEPLTPRDWLRAGFPVEQVARLAAGL